MKLVARGGAPVAVWVALVPHGQGRLRPVTVQASMRLLVDVEGTSAGGRHTIRIEVNRPV
jgi:hypothetical protein